MKKTTNLFYIISSFLTILSIQFISINALSKNLDGGVSGGGGNVICPLVPDQQQKPKDAKDVIKNLKNPMQKYLKFKEYQLNQGLLSDVQKDVFTKVFDHNNSIYKSFDEYNMKVPTESPCFDRQYQPVDGSVVIGYKKEVCISAKNMADKVHKSEWHAQSGALILHEYVEILGHSEDTATKVQQTTLDDLKEFFKINPPKDSDGEDDNHEKDSHKDETFN